MVGGWFVEQTELCVGASNPEVFSFGPQSVNISYNIIGFHFDLSKVANVVR